MIEGPGQKSVEQRNSIEKSGELPGNKRVFQTYSTDIAKEKSRTYIVAEAQEIFPFPGRDLILADQICDDLGAHGKAAQET